MSDPWDRAGNVRLRRPGEPDLELVKFITAYGGETEFLADVTDVSALLRGPCTFVGFVDTWLSPAWRMDFSLEFRPGSPDSVPGADPPRPPADWVVPLAYEEALTSDHPENVSGVDVPPGLSRLELRYLVSGHCTDGQDADEFVSKPNVIRVDGTEVDRFLPWRQDCRRFRDVNPYCRRWADGSWSADYDRSGWCPGDQVAPRRIALTAAGGGHRVVTLKVEGIRPRNPKGDYGYWRVSAALLGWK